MFQWAYIGSIYFLFIYIGLCLPAQAGLCWPANGVLLAALLVSPKRFWRNSLAAAFVASLAANLIFHPVWQSLSFSLGNIAEVSCAAVLLIPKANLPFDLSRPRHLLHFLLFAVLLSPLASLSITEGTQLLRGTTYNRHMLWSLYSADALGIAVMAPMILAIRKDELLALFSRKRILETMAILSGIVALSIAVFGQRTPFLAYVLFPVLLFVLFRLQRSGAAIAAFIMAILAIDLTTRGKNDFFLEQAESFSSSVLLLQSFLATALLTIHAVSAVLAERDRLHGELQAAYREALGSAAIDHLTGVANRGTFEKELLREWNRSARERGSLSLLMIDIDFFKNYNDHYGHVAGDQCLQAVAALLSQSMVRSSDLLARYGGEEFVVILPGSRTEGAVIIADLLRDALVQAKLPHDASEAGIVTLSIGVATLNVERGRDAIALVQAADRALYQAKQGGRNRVVNISIEGQLVE